MFKSQTQIRVRYAETDQMGYVYHGFYAQYYEVGRVEAMREFGFSYRDIEEAGIMMPVAKLECQFIKPGRYDDELTIETSVKKLPGVRMQFEYEIFNSDRELINQGATTLVFVNAETRRPVKCPDRLLQNLLPYFE